MPSKVCPCGQALPLLAPPRLERDEPLGPLAHLVGGEQLAAPEDLDRVEVVGGALVGDGELGEPVDLVAPQVDAHGPVGGGREDVDDRAAHRHLAAVLDLLLAAVAGADELGDELVAVALLAGHDHHGLDVLDVGPEPLHQRPHRCDEHPRRPARRRAAATSCAGGGPSSRPTGDTRSKGSVSHAGNVSTASGPRKVRRSLASRSASPVVGTATTIGRRRLEAWPARRWSGRAPARERPGLRRTGRARTRSRAPHAAAGGGRGATWELRSRLPAP